MIGSGTVGSSVLGLLETRSSMFLSQGFKTKLLPVLVRDPSKTRADVPSGTQFTSDPSVLEDADIIFETMGGTSKALELVVPQLTDGKILITANKAMLAECWDVLKPFMMNGQVYCEASVMAGTPVLGPLTGTLRSSNTLELHAILSGTCNYILTRMESGATYADALSEAAGDVAQTIGADAILCFTFSGSTARRISRERPAAPLLVLTPKLEAARRMGLLWGVHAVRTRDIGSFEEMIDKGKRMALRHGIGKPGSKLVMMAGVPFGTPGSTNVLHVAQLTGDELKGYRGKDS